MMTSGAGRVSRFGRQPVADLLKARGITRVQMARRVGMPVSIFNNTMAGHQTPSQELRDGLVRELGVPLEELFTEEPLAREQGRRYRQGAWLSRGDDPRIVRRSWSRARREEDEPKAG